MLQGKKIAILIAQNYHEEETMTPKEFFTSKGGHVDIIGLHAGTVIGKNNQTPLVPDKSLDAVNPEDYDALIIPGGGAPERIRVDEDAVDFVKSFWNSGRPLAAICHGPQVLISAQVLNGVTLTSYVGIRDDIKNAGGKWVDQPVCVDGQLITSRKPDDLPMFNETLLTALTVGFLSESERDIDALEALELAVNREKGAQEFYSGVADIIKNEAVANKFRYLATIEVGHFEQLSELYQKVSGGKSPVIKIRNSEIGKHKVTPEITSAEAIELAISAEDKAYEFYRSASLKAKNSAVKEMFEYLAAEEIEHKRLLFVDKATLAGGPGHFQWATHFDIPPGMDDLW